jgi:hypothetical protein
MATTGRLTADLILRSPQHLDPTSLYSLDLRGALSMNTERRALVARHRARSRAPC